MIFITCYDAAPRIVDFNLEHFLRAAFLQLWGSGGNLCSLIGICETVMWVFISHERATSATFLLFHKVSSLQNASLLDFLNRIRLLLLVFRWGSFNKAHWLHSMLDRHSVWFIFTWFLEWNTFQNNLFLFAARFTTHIERFRLSFWVIIWIIFLHYSLTLTELLLGCRGRAGLGLKSGGDSGNFWRWWWICIHIFSLDVLLRLSSDLTYMLSFETINCHFFFLFVCRRHKLRLWVLLGYLKFAYKSLSAITYPKTIGQGHG